MNFSLLRYTPLRQTVPFNVASVSFVFSLVCFSNSVLADDIANAARQADEVQRRLQQEQQRQYEEDRRSARKPVHIQPAMPAKPAAREDDNCWDINKVELEGITLLKASTVKALEAKYSKQCIGASEIEQLMSELTYAYMQLGYVTARAYLPQQDLSSGVLKLLIVEGEVEGFILQGDERSVSLANVAPGMEGNPLNLRDLEQMLDQINRLRSNHAQFSIQPGSKAGDSLILIQNEPSKMWHLNTSFDNRGSVSTGQNQLGGTLGLDNLLGFDDYLGVTYKQAQPYNDDYRASYNSNITYVVPYGYNTFTFGASHSSYNSPLTAASGSTLKTRGFTQQGSLRWDYIAYRGQKDRLTISSQLTTKKTKNYLQDILLAVSSRRLTTLDLDLAYNTELYGGQFNVGVGYAKGLHMLGALKDDDNLPREFTRAQFHKWKYNAGYFKPFKIADQSFSINSQLTAQYGIDRLYGSEQISIGGLYTVRGFKDNSIAGDKGYYVRNDLAWYIPQTVGGQSVTFRPYLGFDYGYVRNISNPVVEATLSGAALGLGVNMGPVSLDVFHAAPVQKPTNFDDGVGGVTYFTLSANF